MSGSTVNNVDLQDTNNQNCVLRVNTTNSIMNNLIILQVTLSGWGDYDLTAYYPVPITTLDNAYINGPTEVIYLSNGEPTFSKEPYKLFVNGEVDKTATWSIYYTSNSSQYSTDPFVGALKNKEGEYRLNPTSFYVDGASIYGVQGKRGNDVVWTQPILVIQNKYPSAMVNQWDGKFYTDAEKNFLGVAQIAAGKKDKNTNTFTGVLIGDFDDNSDSSLSRYTGVYGYNKGEQVYALRDDGTATFGRASTGQIQINGSSSTIQSNGFKDSSSDGVRTITGLKLDLLKGNIYASSGVFSGDITINYGGSSGSWYNNYGTRQQSLTTILDNIGSAAAKAQSAADAAANAAGEAQDAAGAAARVATRAEEISTVANTAATDASNALSILQECFNAYPGYKTIATIHGDGSSITLGSSFTVTGDQADFTDCGSVALGRAGNIFIWDTDGRRYTLWEYIVSVHAAQG